MGGLQRVSRWVALFLVSGFVAQASPRSAEPDPELRLIRSIAPGAFDVAADSPLAAFVGHYEIHPDFYVRIGGPMGPSHHLYLFADGTYFYAQAGHLILFKIFDRGKWGWNGRLLQLRTERLLGNEHERDRNLRPIRTEWVGKPAFFLCPSGFQLKERAYSAEDPPEAQASDRARDFLWASWYRSQTLDRKASRRLKRALFKGGWDPKFFPSPEK